MFPKKIFFCIFADINLNLIVMIAIEARKSTSGEYVGLSVVIKNRTLDINTHVSLKMKVKAKDWSFETSLPKKVNDEKPMKELNGLSYAQLSKRLMRIIQELSYLEDAKTLDAVSAKKVALAFINEEVVEKSKALQPSDIDRPSFKEFVKQFIAECESGERLKQRSTRKVAASTIKNYKGTLAQIEAYEAKAHKRIDWEDITMDFYDDWKRFFLKKMYSPNTIGRHVKNLKIWLYAAKDLKLTKTTDFETARFAADHEDVDNVYLTEEKIAEMYAFHPADADDLKRHIEMAPKKEQKHLERVTRSSQARKNLEVAKDIFVVGCLTGQRVSDYKRINTDMIQQLRDGNEYLYLQQEKTKKWIYIPVDERLKSILEKYHGKLPKLHEININRKIKIVGRLLGWTEDANVNEYHGMMSKPSGKKFYECIKTHTARRSFATNAYKNGVPLSSIMAITGHSSEQMLRKYLKLDNKEQAIMAAKEFAKLRKAK